MSKKETLNVLTYNNYQDFLLDFVEQKKLNQPSWGYSQWARDLQLKSTSSITKVLTKQRLPGKSISDRLIKYFEFTDQQAFYFLDLIQLEKTKNNPSLQKAFIDRVKQKKSLRSFNEVELKTFNLISNWYYFAIRELTRLKDFNRSSYWIQKKLKYTISIKEINEAFRSLTQLKLIKSKSGKVKYSEAPIHTINDFSSLAIKSYHSQILDKAKESLYSDPISTREFQSGCLSFKVSDLPSAKRQIREFLQNFAEMNSKNNSDEVYQLSLQFFPLTQNIKKKVKNEI